MNILTITGIVVVAVGTLLMCLGALKSDKSAQNEITSKIEETQKKIEALKSSNPGESDSNKIEQIQNDFNSWADSFIQNKEHLKLDFQKEELNDKGKKLSLNAKWKPFLASFLNDMKNILDAYNKKFNGTVKYDIKSLPDNLFERGKIYQASIEFRKDIFWKFSIRQTQDKSNVICFDIDIINPEDRKENDSFSFVFKPGQNYVDFVSFKNTHFNIKNIKEQYSVTQNAAREMAKDLMESQLLQF